MVGAAQGSPRRRRSGAYIGDLRRRRTPTAVRMHRAGVERGRNPAGDGGRRARAKAGGTTPDDSRWITFCQAPILAESVQKLTQCSGAYTLRPVEISNFKRDSPLPEQNAIGLEKAEPGIVNVRGLGGNTVQFDNLHVSPRHQVLARRHTNVKAPEEEAIEAARNPVNGFLKSGSDSVASIEEYGAPAMGTDLDQLNTLACCRHVLSSFRILAQIKLRHTDSTVIGEDQFLQGASAITDKGGHPFFRH